MKSSPLCSVKLKKETCADYYIYYGNIYNFYLYMSTDIKNTANICCSW